MNRGGRKNRAQKPGAKANAAAENAAATPPDGAPRIIKKYSNRRLYDTRESRYITQERVKELIIEGEDFRVENADDGGDITRQVFLQILLEEEIFGMPIFSEQALRNLIMFYGNSSRGAAANFLDQCIPMFADMQKKFVGKFGPAAVGGGREWEDFAALQGRMLRDFAEKYLNNSMNAYAAYIRAQKRFQADAEKMLGGFSAFGGFPPDGGKNE